MQSLKIIKYCFMDKPKKEMHIPSKKQSRHTGNFISIDYTNNNYAKGTAIDLSLSLKPTSFDFNAIEPWRWEGKDWNGIDIFVTCNKGTTSDVFFSDDFPWTFKEEAKKEIERILKKFN